MDPDDLRAAASPAYFSEKYFRWTPHPYQKEVMDAILRQGARRVAWVAGRRAGKTDTIANVALQKAVKEPGTRVVIFAPLQRQASLLSQRMKELLAGSPYERHVVRDNVSELRLRFGRDAHGKPVESVIYAYPLAGNPRGLGADMLIVDESAFCTDEDFRNKAMPIIAARPEAVVIQISTVWADDDHFSDALRKYGQDPRGAVFRTPSCRNPDVTAEFLAEMRRSMTDAEYRREYEGELVADNGVFDRKLLRGCMKDYALKGIGELDSWEPKRHHDYFLGVDWAKKQDRAVIAVVEQGTQDKANPAKLVFLQVYQPDPDNPRHYTTVMDDVKRVARKLKAKRITADEGEGAYQAEELERAFRAEFDPFRFTPASRNRLVDKVRVLVERGAVVLPLEPDMVRQAFTNVYRTETGYDHASREGKDLFDAIALALRGATDAEAGAAREPMRIATPFDDDLPLVGPGPPLTPAEQMRQMFPPEYWYLLDPE